MNYHHRFVVNAPIEDVRAFHSRSASMGAITPPPIIVQMHDAPVELSEGSSMEFTFWVGPLPLRWRARMTQVGPGGFVDTVERGPFERWVHEHSFVEIDASRTEVFDSLHIEPSRHWFWWIVGRSMMLGLPGLFVYRQWQTRRRLARKAPQGPHARDRSLGNV